MLALQVWVNGKKRCTAGIGEAGVLSSILTMNRRRRESPSQSGKTEWGNWAITLDVGGLSSTPDQREAEHVHWIGEPLKVGDRVSVRIVEVKRVDAPGKRYRAYSDEEIALVEERQRHEREKLKRRRAAGKRKGARAMKAVSKKPKS